MLGVVITLLGLSSEERALTVHLFNWVASRTMGAKPGGSNFKAEVEKARSIYEKLGPVTGEEGEALRKRFDAICPKLG